MTAHAGVSTTGVGASIVSLKTHHRSHGGIKVGDFLENQGNNIKIIGVGTATFHTNFPSGIGSDRLFVDGTIAGLAADTAILVANDELHFPVTIGATFFTIDPVLASAVSTNDTILMNTNFEHERDHNFVVGLASSITEEITEGDAIQINRQMGGYARNVYGVAKGGSQDASGTVYETGVGWVGVTTYVDSEGNLRVKKEILVAMSGISTGNAPSYPNIEHAN